MRQSNYQVTSQEKLLLNIQVDMKQVIPLTYQLNLQVKTKHEILSQFQHNLQVHILIMIPVVTLILIQAMIHIKIKSIIQVMTNFLYHPQFYE